MDIHRARNFCNVSHGDHGKFTLDNRLPHLLDEKLLETRTRGKRRMKMATLGAFRRPRYWRGCGSETSNL